MRKTRGLQRSFTIGHIRKPRLRFFAIAKKKQAGGDQRQNQRDTPCQNVGHFVRCSYRVVRGELDGRVRNPVQLEPHVARGLKTVIRILLQACAHDTLERRRRDGLKHRDGLGSLFQNCVGQADLALAVKRPFACGQFVKNRAQREQVRSLIRGLAFNLLG